MLDIYLFTLINYFNNFNKLNLFIYFVYLKINISLSKRYIV